MNEKRTVFQLLESTSKMYPNKEAIFDGVHRISYNQLAIESNHIAVALSQKGIQKGDRVMVSLPNWYEFAAIYFGLAKIGAISVPCNTRYLEEELTYILENSGATALIVGANFGFLDTFKKWLKKPDSTLKEIITVRFKDSELPSYEDLIQQSNIDTVQTEIIPEEDVFTILYTSGTTGKPKGAMLTHENVLFSSILTVKALECTEKDVYFLPVPLFHVFGLIPGILTAVREGSKMVFLDEYKAINALKLIEQEKATVHYGVPTMFILELNHPDFDKFNLSSLRTGIIAAAPCPEEVVRKIRTDMGCDIQVAYGMTETCAPVTFTSFEDDDYLKSVTVGKFIPELEGKIVDAQRNPVPIGKIGEIAIRGKVVMKGYYKMPEQTKAVFDNEGWFYTGDSGIMDEKGYVQIVGRKRDMIIRGGYNIYPREVEEYFYKHPSVLEVAIIGLPDTVLGEISCAVIKLKPGYSETEESMKEYIKEKVADFKTPDRIVFVEQFPMTASGKIIKHELKNIIVRELKPTLR